MPDVADAAAAAHVVSPAPAGGPVRRPSRRRRALRTAAGHRRGTAGRRTGAPPFRSPRGVSSPPPARAPASPHRVMTCFGPRPAAAGVHREDLADDEPVAEHADRGQVLLHGRRRPRVGPDVGGDVKWLDASSRRPRPSHHPRNCPAARAYAARVRSFAIRPARRTPRTFPTAVGPASTITRGNAN